MINHIIVNAERNLALANAIRDGLPDAQITQSKRGETANQLRAAFKRGENIIAILATGIVCRALGPCLSVKLREPCVVCVSEDGQYVVPILGGHRGGNDLARKIATYLQASAVITTASDLQFGFNLEAPPSGWRLESGPDRSKMLAHLASGKQVDVAHAPEFIKRLPFNRQNGGKQQIIASAKGHAQPNDNVWLYRPTQYVLGVGMERGVDVDRFARTVSAYLVEQDIATGALACMASIDHKADEYALHQWCRAHDIPARFFGAEQLLQQTARLQNPSKAVFDAVGCYGVAEGASLAAVGNTGRLVAAKQIHGPVTLALSQAPMGFEGARVGRARGSLYVIGLGPGKAVLRTEQARNALAAASDVVGYHYYLDMITDQTAGKICHAFSLGKEEARVRHAIQLAGQGKCVALVCSGDAAVYAMGALVFECLDPTRTGSRLSVAEQKVEIVLCPGITALQAASAELGAVIGHDFCAISLSDLLTPAETILQRVRHASKADFVIGFYNPASKSRRQLLASAIALLRETRGDDCYAILARQVGRAEQSFNVTTLGAFPMSDVDMMTLVLIGSTHTRGWQDGQGKWRVYTPRGYGAHADSDLIHLKAAT